MAVFSVLSRLHAAFRRHPVTVVLVVIALTAVAAVWVGAVIRDASCEVCHGSASTYVVVLGGILSLLAWGVGRGIDSILEEQRRDRKSAKGQK
jgi:hypothetical protein